MGLVAGHDRMRPELLAELTSDAALAANVLRGGHPKITGTLYLDKAWNVIHYLLTGQAKGGEGPLAKALMGGRVLIPEGRPGGPAWCLTAEETRQVAEALKAFPVAGLWKGFEQKKLDQAGVYHPSIDFDDATSREYVESYLLKAVDFFVEAAAAGDAVVFSVSA